MLNKFVRGYLFTRRVIPRSGLPVFWIGNYYFMTHQSWIWVPKDFQQDEGEITLK